MSSEPLGNNTKYVSAFRRKKRQYILQETAARILPGERVSWCMMHAHAQTMEIQRAGENLYYFGLHTCGSVWLCPVCSSRIRVARRVELERAASSGYFMVMVSLTLQHSRQDELSALLEALNTAWRKMRAGRKWQEIARKYQLDASCSALEITYSERAGFHPHKHALFFSALPESLFNIEAFQAELSERWQAALAKLGSYASEYYGLKVTRGAAGYLQKWSASDELTSESKAPDDEHYTMWQVLELAGQSAHFRKVFQEYAAATKKKRQLFWSAGARELLGLAKEKSDEEIAAAVPKESVTVAVLSRGEWKLVCKYHLRAELLETAALSGAAGVYFFLQRLAWLEKAEVIEDG